MATKKLLTYEGLQKYNVKWHERLEEMAMSVSDVAELCEDAFDLEPEQEPSTPDVPTESWPELPIQNNVVNTTDTIYLSFGNSFRYEPSGYGTKHITIVNPRGVTAKFSKFRLELIDAGEFNIEWARNIRWKNGSVPQFQPYYTDVIMFETSDNGKTWIGEVVQSTAMTPYWKIVLEPRIVTLGYYSSREYVEIALPINKDALEYVDWGDGTVETASSFTECSTNSSFVAHTYELYSDTYIVTMKSTKFNTGYIVTNGCFGNPYNKDPFFYFRASLYEIINPIPHLKGSYNSSGVQTDGSFSDIFSNCTLLQTIPDTLFKHNPYPVGSGCFYKCSELKYLPPNLFDNDSEITGFTASFSGCINLRAIPEGLFDKHTAATTFRNCFNYCKNLRAIPERLFEKNTAATNFSECFYGCEELEYIPERLFEKNTNATDFSNCFELCYSLKYIPERLFEKNTAATNFSQCFYGCYQLTSIPNQLFALNTNITEIDACFYNCNGLNSFTMHISASNITKCESFVKYTGISSSNCTIYVPANSTTFNSFEAVVQDGLKANIVAE